MADGHGPGSVAPDVTQDFWRGKLLRELPGGGFFVLDTDLRFVLADGALVAELGYERVEIEGRLLQDVTSAAAASVLESLYARAAGGETCEAELAATRTQKRIWVQASPARDAAGAIVGVLVITLDVTERHRAQTALRISERRQRSVVETLEEGILVVSASGSLVSCNRAAQRILGLSGEEILDRTGSDSRWRVFHEDGTPYPPEQLPLNIALATGRSQPGLILAVERPDGQTRWLSVNAVALSESEAGGGAACSFVDITSIRTALEQLRAREVMVSNWMRDSPIGMAFQALDGRYTQVNAALCRLLGRDDGELLGLAFHDVTPPEDRDEEARMRRLLIDGRRDNFQMTKRYVRPAGDEAHALVSVTLMRDDAGRPQQYVVQAVDITQRLSVERELRQRAEQQSIVAKLGERALQGVELSVLLQAAVHAVATTLDVELASLLELDHDRQAVRLAAGHGWPGELVDAAPGPLTDHHARLLMRLEDGPLVIADTAACPDVADVLTKYAVTSSVLVAVAGPRRPLAILAAHSRRGKHFTREDADFIQAVANVLTTAAERRDAEERLRHHAMHDSLTGLPNRLLCLDRLAQALARARRSGGQVALLLLDLDNFKVVNDSLGHHAGDELLRTLTPRLQQAVRAGDTVARLGGDEFVVLCEDVGDERGAHNLAERIAAALRPSFALDIGETRITASIGVVLADTRATPDSLLRDADAAMYRAKSRGRGRHELFNASLRARAIARHAIESELRHALTTDQLRVYYQPYLTLADRRTMGMEALIRWQHPKHGLIAPDRFITIAEESGLILELGALVLRQACRQLAAWQARHPDDGQLRMSVNVSGRQLLQPGLANHVAAALDDNGLQHKAHLLSLEITESVLMEHQQTSQDSLAELEELGVGLVLDDFGTGYSSLSRLKHLPIDTVKIDRSFVNGLAADNNDHAIVAAILGLASAMQLSVIAEGVESEAQAHLLHQLGCPLAQGYLFSRPLPPQQLTELLISRAATRTR